MQKENVLVTGANGQLGSSLRAVAAQSADNWFFTDVAELDITDPEAIEEFITRHGITVVVNCAAYTNVDRAEDDAQMADLLNNKAVENLALAAAKAGAVLIHVSTDYIFSGMGCIPYREEDKPEPRSVYGQTKLKGEEAAIKSGCPLMIFRTAWLYSEYGKNFVKTMRELTATKDSIKVVFDQVGTPTYAADLAGAIYSVITSRKYIEGVYHYSNEGVCSWYDFAKEIARLSGNHCKIEPCHSNEFPSKVKRPHFSVLDKSKVKAVLGVEVPYWKDSLKRCIDNLSK